MKNFYRNFGIVSFLLIFALYGCSSPSGPRGGNEQKTLYATGLDGGILTQGEEEIFVGIFPPGTSDEVVKDNVFGFWHREIHEPPLEKKIVAYCDVWMDGGFDLNTGTAIVPLYEWSGYSPPWTGSGNFDIWLVLSPDYKYNIDNWVPSNWYFYKASNVSIVTAITTVPMSNIHYQFTYVGGGGSGLAAPTGVSASYDSVNNRVNINWNHSVSDVSWYNIWRSENPYSGFVETGWVTSAYNGTWDEDISPGHTYYYKVDAENSSHERSVQSAASNAVTIPGGGGGPPAPTGVSASYDSVNNRVQVQWNAVSGAVRYNIWRSENQYSGFVDIGSVTSTGAYDNGISSGHTYYYKVDAQNSSNQRSELSAVSNAVTISGGGGSPPAAPTGVSAYAASSSSITISWSSVSGASGYYIYRDTSSSGSFTNNVGSTTSTSYTNTGLSSSTTYYYKVSAYNSYGEGPQSSYTYATTTSSVTPPATPTGVSASTNSSSSITISWSSVSGATQYRVYRDTNAGGAFTTLAGTTTATSYANTSLSSNTTYYYKVAAYNSAGESAKSSTVSALTSLDTPAQVTADSNYGGGIYLTWTSISGATNYNIYRSLSSSGPFNSIIAAPSTAYYSDTTTSTGVTYWYVIQPYNSSTGNTGIATSPKSGIGG